ncbi:tetratricopeptide repeat protein [Wenzhouxiangella sp. XN201]|uniref:tetratricopeptide repeat protein n=1 Tax=Wenzhouxiangella sp. XN201 TaxID=2710755 RepID=UPI0013C7F135|nr:tetratricopeptide repeat protein [Wenzhouxiangella sp. XN201]NEZ05002.1 tetratricopeptide repeat protein [Wenzhouxiangella sp. XN201]
MSFWKELQRRNVFRVAAAYVVVAWLLIQVAETILPIFEVPDVFLRGVILVLVLGFPLALFFAWAFELTPDGVKREKEIDREHSAAPRTGRRLDRVIIVVLLLAVGYFVADKYLLTADQASQAPETAGEIDESEPVAGDADDSRGENSLAVLAFDDMSPDNDQEYLADGIAEELLNLLARIPDLRLISRSSSFAYKGRDVSIRRMAEELGVAYILEGSVRKAGNQVRITAQLIDAREDSHVWSHTYDRTLEDIFAIQDEIAAAVVDELKVTLLGDTPTVVPVDPEVYELVLKGRHFANMSTPESFEQAREYFEAALEIDPDNAEAQIGLAVILINETGFGVRSREAALPQVQARLENVLSAHPDHAKANSMMGWKSMQFENDWSGAAAYFERSLEEAPTDMNLVSNALVLLYALARLEEASALYQTVIERDPLNHHARSNLARIQLDAGHLDKALVSVQEALRLSPNAYGSNALLGRIYLQRSDPERAAEAFRLEVSHVDGELGLAMAALDLEPREVFERRRDEWLDQWAEDYPFKAAMLSGYAGEVDRAFEWLEGIARGGLSDSFWKPEFDSLRDDPRWDALLERHGLAPEQREAIQFEIEIPGPDA